MNTNLQISIPSPTPNIFRLKDDENDGAGSFREFTDAEIVNAAIESISYLHWLGLVE